MPRRNKTPKASSRASARRKRSTSSSSQRIEATVVPLDLAQSGCEARAADGTRFALSAAVPGERVRLEPLPGRGQRARVVRVLDASPHRVQAPCAVLDRCGGCSIQSMRYAQQLEAKATSMRHILGDLLERAQVDPIQGLKRPIGYRTRLLMPAIPRKQGFGLGFYQRGSTALVEALGCPVQHPLTLAVLAMARQTLLAAGIEATAPRSDGGWLHGLCVRADPTAGMAELTLLANTPQLPGGRALAEQLAMLPGVAGVHLSVNPERSSYLLGEQFVFLAGHRRTVFHVGGDAFHLSPGSFFQTCAEGAELLAQTVLTMLPEQIDLLADLYGGVGVFARLSAPRWRRALVAESNPQAVEDLRSWLRYSGEKQLEVVSGRVEAQIERVMRRSPDVVVLDPPRSGCRPEVMASIGAQRPPTVLYIACGIEALARDGAILARQGYYIDRVAAVDMFPHTLHLEVVARFVLDTPPPHK
ncbi:MAG: 23S rRNA (uracil(1939)-C(5))-methyltransferase RlmD [Myxococcota bacterium]